MDLRDLDKLLEEFAEAVAARVVEKLSAGNVAGMVDQSGSELGRRRHIAAVRKRVAEGEPGAAIVGRRYFLSRDVLALELAAATKRRRDSVRVDEDAELDRMMATVGLERVTKGKK